MNLPPNTKLPFFAYGIFKEGQISYPIINPYVEKNDEYKISGRLVVRDGIPLAEVFSNEENTQSIYGNLITFRRDLEIPAYQSICNLEPDHYYEWREVSSNKINYNILIGSDIDKGTVVPDNSSDWNSWDDPLFTTIFEVIKELIPDGEEDISYSFDGKSFLKLQMGYLLLWTSIERFVTLRYDFSGEFLLKTILKLRNEPNFTEELSKLNANGYRRIYSSKNTTKYSFTIDKPESILKYYYQVRSNITHRGKASTEDARLVLKCLKDLSTVYEAFIKSCRLNNQ